MSDNKVGIRTLKKKSLETLPEKIVRDDDEVRCAGRLFHRLILFIRLIFLSVTSICSRCLHNKMLPDVMS